MGATRLSPGNASRFWGYEGSCPAPQGELEERVGQRRPAGGSGGRRGGVGHRLPLRPAGPGRRPRPPRGRSRPSPCEEAARLPGAWAGDIGAPARARLSATAPPRLLAARWPRSGQSAPPAARGSLRPSRGDRQRSASSSCWAVSAAPRGSGGRRGRPGGEGGLDRRGRNGPRGEGGTALSSDSPRLHLGEGAARTAPHLEERGVPGARRRGLGRSGAGLEEEGLGSGCEWEGAGISPFFQSLKHPLGAWIILLSLLRVALTSKGLRPLLQAPPPRSPPSSFPPPFLLTAVLKPQESLAQLLPTEGSLKSEGVYRATLGRWPRATRRARSVGRVPFPQGRPQPQMKSH